MGQALRVTAGGNGETHLSAECGTDSNGNGETPRLRSG